MSLLEYHVLLALAGGPLYGYALKEAIAAESGGTIAPLAGSLYRVIARLTTTGLVVEAEPDEKPPRTSQMVPSTAMTTPTVRRTPTRTSSRRFIGDGAGTDALPNRGFGSTRS